MGSYEPSDSLLHVEAMERGLGDDSNFPGASLFDNTDVFDVCENFVIEEFSCPELNTQFCDSERDADDQLIVGNGLVLGTDCALSNDKEDVFAIADEYISYQDQHLDSVDSGIDQVESLAGISRPDDVDVGTDTSEKMPIRNHGDSGISSTESGKGNDLCCLESGGNFCSGSADPQHENAVGSSAENVEIPIASSFLFTQPSEHILKNNHNDAENAMDPLEETVRDHLGVDEEKQDSSDAGKTDSMIQIQRAEGSSCILVNQLPNIVPDCTIEVSTSSEFPQISGALDDSTCRQLAMNIQERDGRSGESICSNVVDSSSLPHTEEQDNIKHDSVSLSTCSDVILSPPRRSTRRNKWCQKVETQRRKPVNKKVLPAELFLNPVRRTRSCPCNRARLSIWGSSVNLVQVKENGATQKDSNPLIQVESQRSHKRTVGPGNGRRPKTHASSLNAAKEKWCASDDPTSHIRLKVKVRGQNGKISPNAVQSDVLDSPVSLPTFVDKCATKSRNSNCTEISETENGIANKLEDNLCDNKQFTYSNGDLEHQVSYPDTHFQDSLHVDKDLESTVTQDTSVGNKFGYCPRGYSQIRTEAMEEATGKQYSDPVTSPDSEVISLTQDVSVGADTVLTSTQAVVPTDPAASSMELMSMRKQKKISKVKGTTDSLAGSFAAEKKMLGQNKKTESAKLRWEEKVGRGCNPTDTSSLASKRNDSRKSLNAERYANGSKVDTISGSCDLSGEHVGEKSSEQLVPMGLLGTGKTMGLKPSFKSSLEVRKQRSAGPFSGRNRKKNACEQRKEDNRKSVNKRKNKEKDSLGQFVHHGESHRETGGGINLSSGTTEQSELQRPAELIKDETMGIEVPNGAGIPIGNNFASEDLSKSSALSSNFDSLPLPNAWVRCDDCHKWRCISTELADSIEATNCRWICNENLDKAFADCSIPQEKSNAEINAELEIAEVSGEEDASFAHPVAKGFQGNNLTVPQLAPWRSIQSNLFLHRSRKTQIIDEIMICHCKPPLDGGLGCGDECLNRILNIECVRGTCPCGDRCSNQQFQKRKYAKLENFRCGKKGYGLQLLESVSSGDFLIEYVGEVLDLNAYEARQKEYASRGQKHFYFMTLNGSEVIDACAKGNLGRFINHSCDPNCRTEKWMVNGEVCIGLFAIRNIKKGEEVTFDYNYVRVFGAAAKRCVCGSSECRGYIGGDPLNNDAVVQGDSDEEYPEPVMINGDGEIGEVTNRGTSNTPSSDVQQLQHIDQMVMSASSIKQLGSSMKEEESTSGSRHAVQPIEIPPVKEETINKSLLEVQPLDMPIQTGSVVNKLLSSTQPLKVSLLKDDIMSETMSTIQLLEASSRMTDTMGKSLPDHVTANAKSISDTVEEKPNISKARSPAKSSRSSSSIKKGKSRSNFVIASKPQVPPNKLKKVLVGAANSGPKGVEEKLNEVLDTDGGISKRKDATKGYLKLLIVTASSGDNINGEAFQSTRDLSIILDALLKTKKRNVLTDIINKNGLQMLHNIMKQNRKYFNRIPIIRKLLKILEYLAEKEILTLELINSGPPCAGMESFRESINQLTRHNDVKVHQTARNFRDKWMHRTFKRNSYSDRDDINVEQQAGLHRNRFSTYKRWCGHDSRPIADIDSISQTAFGAVPSYANTQKDSSGPSVNSYLANGTTTRKRKSRWDQPGGGKSRQSLELVEGQDDVQEQVHKVNDEIISCGYDHNISQHAECAASDATMQQIHDDTPPGFPSPLVPYDAFSTATSNLSSDIHQRICSCEVVTGCHQERYLSQLPVSYGVPLFFVDQLGTPQVETVDSWEISPGIPFRPFPPLPPYHRKNNNALSASRALMENGESQRDSHRGTHHNRDAGIPCTSGTRPQEAATGAQNKKMAERMRCLSGNLWRRNFRPQNWNNDKRPPWVRNRTGWGFKANNSRSGTYSLGVGNVENKIENVCRSDGVGEGDGENINSALYQNSQHHCDH